MITIHDVADAAGLTEDEVKAKLIERGVDPFGHGFVWENRVRQVARELVRERARAKA